jgi:hypothetical protein
MPKSRQAKEKEEGGKKLTIYVSEETRKALRIRAIEEDTNVTKLVERMILDYLKAKPKNREGK